MPQDLVFASLAKDKRITVNALCQNHLGTAFWRAVGFTDYCLTLEIYPDLKTTNARRSQGADEHDL
jgi:hypothetical protein